MDGRAVPATPPVSPASPPRSVSLAVEQARLAACNGQTECRGREHGDDICLLKKQKYPNKPAIIANGVKRPDVTCPRGLWPE